MLTKEASNSFVIAPRILLTKEISKAIESEKDPSFVGVTKGSVGVTRSLNGNWAFRTDPNNVGETQGWQKADFSTQNWDEMPVPGNWDLRNEYAHYAGKGWYRKTFVVANDLKNKTLLLNFEAVYHDCTVWLNSKKLGENHSGFLPFEFEVSSLVNFGQPNTLVVCADNTFRRGAIWNWGFAFVMRTVKLCISNARTFI
jgi:beta-galactosidase